MRETRLSGSEGGAGSIPVPTPIVARAFQPVGLGRAVRSVRRQPSAFGFSAAAKPSVASAPSTS
jgi:hypothetical protein